MEEPVVGGMPYFHSAISRWLPKNKKKRDTLFQIQMIVLTYVTYSLFNMARRPMAVVKSNIIKECNTTYKLMYFMQRLGAMNNTNTFCEELSGWGSTEQIMGFMDALFILFYGLCLYMSGIVADCYNPRFYLTTGCLLSGFFCCLLGLAEYWEIHSFKFMGTVLVLFGASQSTAWPVVLSTVTHWYSSGGKRGTFFGFWNTHNYLGSVIGIFLAGIWADGNWRWSFFAPGFILAFMGVLVFFCMVADPIDLKDLEKNDAAPSMGRRPGGGEDPIWLSSNRSIKMYDAWTLPGVVEFSTCMFFSRMVGYIFLYWLPVFVQRTKGVTAMIAACYSIAYVLGGSIGGILAGILVDLFRRSAVVCALFLVISIPILFLGIISDIGKSLDVDFPIILLMGLFVEAPYVVTSTSVSADLATHKVIKRNHRALSTIGGIIEGTGAVGAAIGTFACGFFITLTKWENIFYLMMALQFVAILCLSRQAYKDFVRKQKRRKLSEYWSAPSF